MGNKAVRTLMSVSTNLLFIVLGIYIVVTIGSKAYTFGTRIFNEQAIDMPENARSVEVTIKQGISPKELSTMLYDRGLVNDKLVTFFQIEFSDYKKKMIEGTYILSTDMTPTKMMQVMSTASDDDSQDTTD